jgi:hypothetical protein
MRIRFRNTHHWPNIASHTVLGLCFIAMSGLLIAFPIREIDSSDQWVTWGWVPLILSLVVGGLGFRLLWEPIGYLQEITIEPMTLRCTHFFGKPLYLSYKDIESCTQITTNPDYGSGNPAIVLRVSKYPYRYVLNLKGHQNLRRIELLCIAINHKIRYLSKQE